MTLDEIDLWQVPVLVMAAIIPVALLVEWVLGRVRARLRLRWLRVAGFAALAGLVVVVLVAVLGLSQADQLASVAAGVSGVAALLMTWRSYQGGGRTDRPDDGAAGRRDTTGGDPPRR